MPRSETPLRSDLFPEISPYASGMLAVDGRHTIYWEQSGNPEGVPVLFLHGGPGAGSAPVHRRFFDPQFYRIVVFDQRGCGRSMPLGEIHDNTTSHLVADMEKLRTHLGIAQWLLFGGSWGSTLALAYADSMTRTPTEISDALFAELRKHFDEAQLVELTATVAWENYRARFNHAFGIESANFTEGAVCALPVHTGGNVVK